LTLGDLPWLQRDTIHSTEGRCFFIFPSIAIKPVHNKHLRTSPRKNLTQSNQVSSPVLYSAQPPAFPQTPPRFSSVFRCL
jgi:hypothetical protein